MHKYLSIILAISAFTAVMTWLFIGILRGNPYTDQTSQTNSSLATAPDKNRSQLTPLIIGDPNAKVSIIEYSDFKCPECGKFHSGDASKKIRENYVDTGKVNIIFRPYPLYAVDGAKALAGSYCAQAQGLFENYHDTLFSYMWDNYYKNGDYQKAIDPVFTEDLMELLLLQIGINPDEYFDCLENPATETAYFDDLELAGPDDIRGTPTFIIGEQTIVGPQPYNVFQTLLELELR